MSEKSAIGKDFIREIIDDDLNSGKHKEIITRFPPEPNGYLHVGHAKSICLNFGIAREYGGKCHLRFDDTNPSKEEVEYVDSIMEDIRWLGFDWGEHLYYASDYFPKIYDCAVKLIEKGKAYVCKLDTEAFKEYRGVPTRPGKESPWRNRPVEESLDLFRRMKAGEFGEGEYVLRAKIDMTSPNLHMRDPVIYRIKYASHHRTGDDWCVYPMYDFAHCISDSIEKITHSICTLEFEVHRPLYDWILEALEVYHPRQIEFARLNLTYTVMSKRKLLELVEEKHVRGWDDPRIPTISGLRRRGYTPEAIRNFCSTIGVTKYNGTTEVELLEHCLRDDLNKHSRRVMGVTNPLKVVITNYPADREEMVEAVNNPEDPSAGTREIPFCGELYIEKDDFMENPSKKFFRLSPGKEVRLRYAYLIKCEEVIKDNSGEVVELRCSYDPDTLGANPADGRKVKGVIHWVSAKHCIEAEARMYGRLFTAENPDETGDFKATLNPDSLNTVKCMLEPAVGGAKPLERFQFERKGYFCVDPDSSPDKLVFNLTVPLRDSFAKTRDQGKTS